MADPSLPTKRLFLRPSATGLVPRSAGLVEFDAAFMQEARQGVQRESA
jgi:hypothetical protein